ncbi:MAG: hypothetical protein AAF901_03080, partial [Bacteroidota bacterium]
MKTISIKDETPAGEIINEIVLKFNEEYITVIELIKARIETEIDRYKNNAEAYKKGLVLPTDLESRLNKKKPKDIDSEKQLYIALEAFKNNGFILLVDDEQVERLDQ